MFIVNHPRRILISIKLLKSKTSLSEMAYKTIQMAYKTIQMSYKTSEMADIYISPKSPQTK
jgi:hypothetical protein